MKAKITRPDGTVIEIEGTADEVDRVVNPNVIRWPWSVPAIPFPNVPNIPDPIVPISPLNPPIWYGPDVICSSVIH